MQRSIYVLAFLAVAAFTGCSQSVPGCNSDSAVQLVKQIAGEELERQVGSDLAREFSFAVEAVRTTRTDEQTGAHDCAAELHMHGISESNNLPIEFTVENTDDGEHVYVNVYGL